MTTAGLNDFTDVSLLSCVVMCLVIIVQHLPDGATE